GWLYVVSRVFLAEVVAFLNTFVVFYSGGVLSCSKSGWQHPSPFPVITNLCTTPEDVRSRVEKIPDHHLSYEDRRGCRVATVKYMKKLGCCLHVCGMLGNGQMSYFHRIERARAPNVP
ncbi:unnamed protein product, partial [Ascophyllum nodosum]